MKHRFLAAVALAGMLGAPASVVIADSDIQHNWNAEGEVGALKVFRDKYVALGGTWKETAFPDTEQSINSTKARILGGNPPMAMESGLGGTLRDFADSDMLQDMDRVATKENWDERLPAGLADWVKKDGHYIAAPVFVDVINWMYTNNEVLKAAGVEAPNTWDEFMASLPKIKAAGYTPIAVGGEAWQEAILFDHILLAVGGPDLYNGILDAYEPAITDGLLLKAFQVLGSLREFTDEGKAGRSWNDTATLIASGKAGYFFMGPWATGAFGDLGDEGGKWSCRITPWSNTVTVVPDGFLFIKVTDQADLDAQALFASAAMDPETQIAAAREKNTLPAIKGADPALFAGCPSKAVEVMGSGETVQHWNGRTSKVATAVKDAVTNFWNGDETPEEAVAAFTAAIM